MGTKLSIPQKELAEFCKQHHIAKLSFFGSALRDDFRADIDIDFLVEFEPGHVPGLITLSAMQIELSDRLGHPVDLRTPASLSRYFRQQVIDMAQVQYERT